MAAVTQDLVAAQAMSSSDSFDDDLVWILEKLIGRVGGEFGLICRFQAGEDCAAILARGGQGSSAELETRISDSARSAVKFHRRRRDDDAVSMMQSALEPSHSDRANYRVLCLSFLPAQNVCTVASVCRTGATPFDGRQELVAGTLYPVLARYIRLWWLHRTERRRANALGAALDISDIGIVLLDRRTELLFANGKATDLLDAADGLVRNDRSVTAQALIDGARFQAAIQHAVYCNSVGLSSANGTAEIQQDYSSQRSPILSLRRRNGKRALIVTVMSVERVAVDPVDPAVIVYVLDPAQDVQRLLAPACHIYKLSAAESRLVYHLVSGLSLSEGAGMMRIRIHTARAYLKKIFLKTDTNRQADLVRVMLSSLLRTNSRIDVSLL